MPKSRKRKKTHTRPGSKPGSGAKSDNRSRSDSIQWGGGGTKKTRTFDRLVLPLIVAALFLWGLADTIWPHRPIAVFTRSGCVITALMLYFAAIPAVSVSLAAAGLFTSPIFVVLISVAVFGERVGPRRLAAMVLGFVGVCLVLRIGTEPIRAMAVTPIWVVPSMRWG